MFRKRAIAGGGGLGRDHVALGELAKCVMDSGTYPCASVSTFLLLSGLAQILLRHLGAVSQNAADQTIMRFGVQDVSRMLAYGTAHVRYLLSVRPHEAIALGEHLDEVENATVGLLCAPLTISALAVVTAGGREAASSAIPTLTALYRRFSDEHAARRHAAGIPSAKSPLEAFVQRLEA